MEVNKIIKKIHVLVIALFILPAIPMAANALPAFPGAQGWGKDSIGGRSASAKLYKVNSLANDSIGSCSGNICTGTLRYALTASGPRFVIFTVGGTINLTTDITVWNPYLTVAGQTAPGGGILIRGPNIGGDAGLGSLRLYTHDHIIRGLRLRDTGKSAIGMGGNRENPVGAGYNFIIDHNSMSWHDDTILEVAHDAHNVTISNNIISESTPEVPSGVAGNEGAIALGPTRCDQAFETVANRWTRFISLHHNLFAHNRARNPLLKFDAGENEIINNVVYNWDWRGIEVNTTSYISRNVLIPGPSTSGSYSTRGISVGDYTECPNIKTQPGTVMVTHNIGPNRPTDTGDDWLAVDGGTSQFRTNSLPFAISGMVEDDVMTLKNNLLANVGATAPYRDSVDVRVINDVINGTGATPEWTTTPPWGWPTIDSGTYPTDTDGDGIPDSFENANGMNPNDASDWNGDTDRDGYLNIEEYINSFFPAGSRLPSSSALIPNPPSIIGVN